MSEIEKSNETEEEKLPEIDLTLLSKEDLLAIITEMVIDKKDLLEKILATNESEGVSLNNVKKDNFFEVLVGKEIKVCYAKEDIDEFEKVTFVNTGKGDELFASPLKTYSRDIKYKISIEYDSSDNPVYYGESIPGINTSDAKWRIKEFIYDVNDNVIDIKWADGTYLFNKVWDNRANYTYN